MFRLIRAFFYDRVSWALLVALFITLVYSVTSLFNRYEELDQHRYALYQIQSEIRLLQEDLEEKNERRARLESDPTAWEHAAREKMNFLGPDEVLVTFKAVR